MGSLHTVLWALWISFAITIEAPQIRSQGAFCCCLMQQCDIKCYLKSILLGCYVIYLCLCCIFGLLLYVMQESITKDQTLYFLFAELLLYSCWITPRLSSYPSSGSLFIAELINYFSWLANILPGSHNIRCYTILYMLECSLTTADSLSFSPLLLMISLYVTPMSAAKIFVSKVMLLISMNWELWIP